VERVREGLGWLGDDNNKIIIIEVHRFIDLFSIVSLDANFDFDTFSKFIYHT